MKHEGSTRIPIFPANADNVVAFVLSENGQEFWSIDPGSTTVVEKFLSSYPAAECRGVLLTHHHYDHTSGLAGLREKWPSVRVYGPAHTALQDVVTHTLSENSAPITLAGLSLQTLVTPGHTVPALSYVLHGLEAPCLFAGDTLFGGGCGRLFEGTATQMWSSLKKLRELPDETWLYCGHEYTEHNLRFVQSLGWRTGAVEAELEKVSELRSQARLTLPRRLSVEKLTNPFLNADDLALKIALGLRPDCDDSETFGKLRLMRNTY